MNRLYYGDCLTVMQEFALASVDLIYLDPPFNSEKDYNAIYKTETGLPLPDQVEAFCDTWNLDEDREREIRHMPILLREAGIADEVAEFWKLWMNALRETQPRLLAYLAYMVPRLIQMKSILKSTGSLYLHCDPTAAHYIKVIMDGVFGHENFRSEISWKRTSAHSGAKRYGPVHDTIFFYSKTSKYVWNDQFTPYDESYIEEWFDMKDEDGRRWKRTDLTGAGIRRGATGIPWRGIDVSAKGRHWARSPDDLDKLDAEGRIHWPKKEGGIPRLRQYPEDLPGVTLQDVWTDIRPIHNLSDERMGYKTQKPVALLERIIRASSNHGDTVLDPFCGCASTIEAAERLNRKWIGIDIAIHAIKRVGVKRLRERLGLIEGTHFRIDGVPRNVEGARDLWNRDKYQFQKWCVEQVDGFVTAKKTADGGIDGRLYFHLPMKLELDSMVLEVKGGAHVSIADLRALHGVMERTNAEMAGLIVLNQPKERQLANFTKQMASAGDLEANGIPYPRMQLLSVQDIFEGKRFRTPTIVGKERPDPHFEGFEALAPQVNRPLSP